MREKKEKATKNPTQQNKDPRMKIQYAIILNEWHLHGHKPQESILRPPFDFWCVTANIKMGSIRMGSQEGVELESCALSDTSNYEQCFVSIAFNDRFVTYLKQITCSEETSFCQGFRANSWEHGRGTSDYKAQISS